MQYHAVRRKRGGFTLIELMVVVLLISLLFCILLPAVGRVREAARRSVCTGRLAQIGVALANYHDAFNVLPPAYTTKLGGDAYMGPPDPVTRDTGPGWGWLMMLLPEMDQGPLYGALNLNLPCWDLANTTGTRTLVASYLCPSVEAPAPFAVRDRKGSPIATFAPAHYVANAGRVNAWDVGVDDLTTIPGVDGPFFRNSRIRIADIPDGTSLTVFAGERISELGDATWVGVVPGAQVCSKRAKPPAGSSPCRGAGALVGAHSGPSPYESPSEICSPSGVGHADQMGSNHTGGGSNVLLGDGSVRYLSGALKPEQWAAYSTRNGGEMVSDSPW